MSGGWVVVDRSWWAVVMGGQQCSHPAPTPSSRTQSISLAFLATAAVVSAAPFETRCTTTSNFFASKRWPSTSITPSFTPKSAAAKSATATRATPDEPSSVAATSVASVTFSALALAGVAFCFTGLAFCFTGGGGGGGRRRAGAAGGGFFRFDGDAGAEESSSRNGEAAKDPTARAASPAAPSSTVLKASRVARYRLDSTVPNTWTPRSPPTVAAPSSVVELLTAIAGGVGTRIGLMARRGREACSRIGV